MATRPKPKKRKPSATMRKQSDAYAMTSADAASSTRAAVSRLGARVIDFPWNDSFADARNDVSFRLGELTDRTAHRCIPFVDQDAFRSR